MRSEAPIRPVSAILIALLGLVLLAPARPAFAAERGTITLRGTVLDESGAPLADTWVFSKGSRRVSALSNDDGSYLLEVPGGTVAELIRAPVKLQILAQRKDWRMRLADGAPELLLELRIFVDSAGTARLRVRSSDPAVAATVAGEAVLSTTPSTTLTVDFRGTPEPSEGPKKARITAVEEVVLNGIELPPGQPSAARPGPIVIPTGLRAGTRASGQATEEDTGDEVEDRAPAVGEPAERTTPTPAPTKELRQLEAERKAEEKKARKEAKKKETERRRAAKKTKKDTGTEAPPEPPGVKETTTVSSSPPRVYRPAEPPDGAPAAEPRVYRPALDPKGDEPTEEAEAPRVYRPAEPANRDAAPPSPQAPRVLRSATTALYDTTAMRADSAAAAPQAAPPASDRVEGEAPSPEKTPPPAPAKTAPETDAQRTPPTPDPLQAPEPAAEPDAWCTCRIEGFVEVRSEQRLNGFLRVRVWLEGHPEIRGEVELFMGSPRAFVLRSVPCGPQQLRFEARSRQTFDLVSPDPKVDCTDGGVRQVRLVLEPSKRRR